MPISRVIVLADCVLAAVLAVLLLLTDAAITPAAAFGWLFAVLALYLASLLVP